MGAPLAALRSALLPCTQTPSRQRRGRRGRLIGCTRGGLNYKLHIVADTRGRPIRMFLSAGQTSDYVGTRALLSSLPQAKVLLADRGYDANWLREALAKISSPASRRAMDAPAQLGMT